MSSAAALTAMLIALLVASCAPAPEPESAAPVAPAGAALPPFRPAAPDVKTLMATVITLAAESYWESVAITIDESGVTEDFPETDDEWWHVRSAAMTLAESGNLLMLPSRAVDDSTWIRFSEALVDVGLEAVAAADSRDPEQIFAAGEKVYDVCTACHGLYIKE